MTKNVNVMMPNRFVMCKCSKNTCVVLLFDVFINGGFCSCEYWDLSFSCGATDVSVIGEGVVGGPWGLDGVRRSTDRAVALRFRGITAGFS